jgi:hypothetical protein
MTTTQTAVDAYITKIGAITAKLAALTMAAESHFDESPDAINWGHVGTVTEIDNMLADVMQFAGVQ